MDLEKLTQSICTSIKAGKYTDAKIMVDHLASDGGNVNEKITALSNIADQYIKAEQFKAAREVAEKIYALPRQSYGNAPEINNLKLKESSKVICELIKYKKLELPLTWVLTFVSGFDADSSTQVQEFTNIACWYIKTGQFKDANSLVHSILVTRVDETEKIAALTRISQEFLSAEQANEALQIDRIIASKR
jgi:hypothetical protein